MHSDRLILCTDQVQAQIEDLRRQLAQEQQLRQAAQQELEELGRQAGSGAAVGSARDC
jgi:hypothetical protein